MQRIPYVHFTHADTFTYRGLVYSGRTMCGSATATSIPWPTTVCGLYTAPWNAATHPPQQPVKLIGVYVINSTCVKMQQVKVTTHIQSLKGVQRTLPHTIPHHLL